MVKFTCDTGKICHINGKGNTKFGTMFPQKLVLTLASSSVQSLLHDGGTDGGTSRLLASGTLIEDAGEFGVVLSAAHTIATITPLDLEIMLLYECDAKSAPSGTEDQYFTASSTSSHNTQWDKPCTPVAVVPQGKVVNVLEQGHSSDIDYALLLILWNDAYLTNFYGTKVATFPRAVDPPRPGTTISQELIMIGHPDGSPTLGMTGKLLKQMGPHPDSGQGQDYGYVSFQDLKNVGGFSGSGVFNNAGDIVGVFKGTAGPNVPTDLIGKPAFLDLGQAAKAKGTDRLKQWFQGQSSLIRQGDILVGRRR
jgi:hypothetical protein